MGKVLLPLRTERLVLREFEESDFEAVHRYASDPEVVRYVDFGPNTEEETRAFLRQSIAAAAANPRRLYHLAIALDTDDRVIGGCGIYLLGKSGHEASIGYTLAREHWRRGLGTETARALIKFGFERLGLRRITATCDPNNVASWRVMEKAGMRREAQIPRERWQKGAWRDSFLYAVLKQEWEAAATAPGGQEG